MKMQLWKRRLAQGGETAMPVTPPLNLLYPQLDGRSRIRTAISFCAGVFGPIAKLSRPPLVSDAARSINKSMEQAEISVADVLLVSSNGAGLGHLTRLYAIHRKLRIKSMIYTLSAGYTGLRMTADKLVYFPSAQTLKVETKVWNQIFSQHFSAVVAVTNPKIIVFDGTYVYRPVLETCRRLGIELIWLQRGYWKTEVSDRSWQRVHSATFTRAVLVPGDYAGPEALDFEKSAPMKHVDPILAYQTNEVFSREEARTALRLSQNKKYALVQLGAGTINEIAKLRDAAISAVRELGTEWEPVVTRNPLNESHTNKEVHSVSVYPISKYLRGFDFVVSAAGYNSVQEAVAIHVPLILVPNTSTKTDDQLARAHGVVARGFALLARDPDQLAVSIRSLGDDEFRAEMSNTQRSATGANGAEQAAAWIESLLPKTGGDKEKYAPLAFCAPQVSKQ